MFKLLLFIPALFCLVGTVFCFIKDEHWWVRIFDFPRLQMLAFIGVSAVMLIWASNYPVVRTIAWIALGAATVYHCWVIFPYTSWHSKQVVDAGVSSDDKNVVSIMVANVLMYNRTSEPLKKLVEEYKPDILMVVETDPWWHQQLIHLDEEYKHILHLPLDNTYGLLFYSNLPIQEEEIRYVMEDSVPSVFAQITLPDGDTIDFYGIHPKPPTPSESKSSAPRDAELVLVGREIKKRGRSAIVAGDLNDVAWSHTSRLFRRLSNLMDPRIGRGMYSTFHAKYPLMRWPLDHVFHSDDFQLVKIERLPHIESDHFPIYIELAHLPSQDHEQETPKADAEDQQEADRKVEEAIEFEVKENKEEAEEKEEQKEEAEKNKKKPIKK